MFQSRMTYLCLLNNKIGDEGLLAMSKCLSKIKKLSIGDSNDMNLSLNGIAALANELKSLSSKVPVSFFEMLSPPIFLGRYHTSNCTKKDCSI